MHILKLLSVISIILLTACQSTTPKKDFEKYDPLIWSAMIAYTDAEYEQALALFQEAFEVIPDDSENDLFHAAAAALHIGKDEIAEDLIRKSVSGANANISYFRNFQGFVQFKDKELFARIEKDYDELESQYYAKLPYPKEVVDEIKELVAKDQEVRQNSDRDQMAIVDSINMDRLIKITKEHGWISRAWLLVWHQRGTHKEDNRVWNHFRPLINKEIEEGKIRKDFWAFFDDELSIRDSEQQIYGMYGDQFPVIDVDQVDERRKTLGLPSLWYLHKVYESPLPEGYVTQELKP